MPYRCLPSTRLHFFGCRCQAAALLRCTVFRSNFDAQENSGKDSTAVWRWRWRREAADRQVRAGVDSPTEPRRLLRSDSALQTDVRSGIATNANSSRFSSSGRLDSPVIFPANFRFRIRPLPDSTDAARTVPHATRSTGTRPGRFGRPTSQKRRRPRQQPRPNRTAACRCSRIVSRADLSVIRI